MKIYYWEDLGRFGEEIIFLGDLVIIVFVFILYDLGFQEYQVFKVFQSVN